MPTAKVPDTNERLSRLETTVEALHDDFADVRGVLKDIQGSLARGRETNWSVIFAGLAVVGSLYAAAIRPLSQEIERSQHTAETLSQAVVLQNGKIESNTMETAKLGVMLDAMTTTISRIERDGSPITDRRLSVIEHELKLNQ